MHKCGSPCEHSLQRLFATTPIGCEHSARHLFTRRAAVVHKWWRESVFRLVGDDAKCINIQSLYKYAKTEPLRIPYLGRDYCLIENTRFFALRLYKVEHQSSTNMYKSIRTGTSTSFGQFDERCKIYVSLQVKRKNVNKVCFVYR